MTSSPSRSAGDEALCAAVRADITAAFDGRFPEGVTVAVSDRRVSVSGCVDDADAAQRIEKAAAARPGVLGVHNALSLRQPAPAPQDQPAGTGMHADPAQKASGQVNHKV